MLLGRGNSPFYPSWVLGAGLLIKLAQSRITGEYPVLLCIQRTIEGIILCERSGTGHLFIYLLQEDTINW